MYLVRDIVVEEIKKDKNSNNFPNKFSLEIALETGVVSEDLLFQKDALNIQSFPISFIYVKVKKRSSISMLSRDHMILDSLFSMPNASGNNEDHL